MPSTEMTGMVQTVLGLVQPSELGPTMTHEHLYIDFSFMYRPPQDSAQDLADDPITLENVGWVRYNYYSNHANLQLMDLGCGRWRRWHCTRLRAEARSLMPQRSALGANAKALERISMETGVHVVMGAGFYVDAVHPHGHALAKCGCGCATNRR